MRPATYDQGPAEGVQFYRLHQDIAAVLEAELRDR